MPAPRVQLEDLLALAQTLRDAGFALGTQQYIAAHELLIALAAQGRLPADPLQWRTLLAPIFCSSPREQTEFAEHFAAWLQRRPQWQLATAQSTTRQSPTARSSAFRRLRARLAPGRLKAELQTWLEHPAPWLTALAVVLLLAFSVVYLKNSVGQRPAASPTVTPTAQPSPTPVPSVAPAQGAQPADRRWLAVVPLLLYALWLLWRGWRRKLILQKLQTSGTPRLQQINLARDRVALFDSPVFRRTLIELRRHQHSASGDLDVAATVHASIRQGGFFTPAYGWRRMLPEYLLLIDRASLHDEQAHLGAELAEQLKASEIGVDWFYFQGDARACRRPEPFARSLTLNELAARYPAHRLLVFGDGAGFFDPFSGQAQRWLEEFEPWTERALITPVAPAGWGYREATLAEHDFLLLPLSAAGFEALTTWLNTGLKPALRPRAAPPFPALITERPKRWLERVTPPPAVAAQLLAQLRAYLDDAGWQWLCACAVYPQLTWDLTRYLGARLFGQPDAWDERLLRLVRLPWFRYGTMPDWLRSELLASFTDAQETQVRRVIEDLLRHVLTKPGEAISLEVVAPPEAQAQGWRRLTAELQQWRQRRELHRLLQAQPEESPLRDQVFLSFLVGERPPRLAVQAPELWRRLLFTKGQSVLGVRAVTVGVAALATGLVLLSGIPLYVLAYSVLALAPGLFVGWWALLDHFARTAKLPDSTPAIVPEMLFSPSASEPPAPISETTVAATPLAHDVSVTLPDTLPVFEVAQTAAGHRVKLSHEMELELVNLSGGEFTMGGERYGDEQPKHQVRVAPFAIGKYQVTQAQWQAVMGNNPSRFKGEDLPVESVSWEDAVQFCERLSQLTGVQFRLPTEAEWEYACRAGTTTEYCFGDDEKQLGEYAWYGNNSGNQTHPVGQKLPNKFGLYDMHGNVWEWCQDLWHENYQDAPTDGSAWLSGGNSGLRVLRGGAWYGNSSYCRSAYRGSYGPGVRINYIGFHVVVSTRMN
jgi:formylglycine-generating enzyme required for sulfatase activity/uncharacterized protein with von Willebrand factor type A (vWA) domain